MAGSGDTASLGGGSLTIAAAESWTIGTSGSSSTVALSCSSSTLVTVAGTLIYRGAVNPCGAWVFEAGATVKHDSSAASSPSTTNYAFTFPFSCSGCSLALNGSSTSPITWGIAASSGNAGPVGTYSAGTDGNITATYVNWANIGTTAINSIQTALTTSGDTLNISNSTCNPCGMVTIGALADGSNLLLTNFIVTSVDTSGPRSLAIGGSTGVAAMTTGVRQITGSYFGGVGGFYLNCAAAGTAAHLTVQNDVFYASGTAGVMISSPLTCSFAGSEWSNNLLWSNPNSASGIYSDIPGGTLNSTFGLASNSSTCTSENLHFADAPEINTVLAGWVFEGDCYSDTTNITGKAVLTGSGTSAHTLRLTQDIVLQNTAGLGGGAGGTGGTALLLFDNDSTGSCDGSSVFCPVVESDHNTIFGTNGFFSGLYWKEGPVTQNPMVSGVHDNIEWLPSSGPMGQVGWTDNMENGAVVGAGCNWYWNNSGAGTNYQTAGGNVEYSTPSTPGGTVGSCSGDKSGNPQFFDATRNFLKWDQTLTPGDTTWTQALAHFASITAARAGYTPTALVAWVRAGFAPSNQTTATADSAGGQIGAVPVNTTTTTPILFFSDITNGPATGGENGHGAYVCIFGRNFGATQGSSTITVGGGAVTNYVVWVDEGFTSHRPASAHACFQLGSAVTGNIVLTVGGVNSNGLPFTVRSGRIWCMASAGDATYPGSNSNNGFFPNDPTETSGTRGCKNTWYNIKHTGGFAAGDIVYVLEDTATGVDPDNYYSYYGLLTLAGSSTSNQMAFLGYPQRAFGPNGELGASNGGFDMGSNTLNHQMIGVGSEALSENGSYWVVGNLSLRCLVNSVTCLGTEAPDTSTANYTTGDRWVDVKVQAPGESDSETAAWTPENMNFSDFYGLEITNIGCGFGATGINPATGLLWVDDGATIPGQTEQYRCTENAGAYPLTTSGTTLTDPGAEGFLKVGDHVCIPNCSSGFENVIVNQSSTSSFTLNVAFPTNITGSTGYTYLNNMGENLTHAVYFGGSIHDVDIGWNWLHNSSVYRVSQNPNYYNILDNQITSSTENAEPVTNAAQIILAQDCVTNSTAGSGLPFACISGDPVQIMANNGNTNDTSADPSLTGEYYMKAGSDNVHWYVYADPALTTPVTGSLNCSGGACGFIAVGRIPAWDFYFHDNYLEGMNGNGLAADCLSAGRGPVEFYRNVFSKNAQGPTYDGIGGIINTIQLLLDSNLGNLGVQQGSFQIFNNTFYDSGRGLLTTDVPSGGLIQVTTSAIESYLYGGSSNPNSHALVNLQNNLFYNTLSTSVYLALYSGASGGLDSASTKNIFYGGDPTAVGNLGFDTVATMSTLNSTQITCTSPCSTFYDQPNGTFALNSPGATAATGGVATSLTTDLAGTPLNGNYPVGAYAALGGCMVTTTFLPDATDTQSYSQTATESGCPASTWSVASGSLPSWASLNSSTGAITGTASGTALATFTLGYSTATSGTLSITTYASPTIPYCSGSSLTCPGGSIGVFYSNSIAVSGGVAPFTCSTVSGALPAGVTWVGCALEGTPTGSPAGYTFQAKVTDTNGVAYTNPSSFSLTIGGAGNPFSTVRVGVSKALGIRRQN